jgi:hypothetical protein
MRRRGLRFAQEAGSRVTGLIRKNRGDVEAK